MPDVPLQLLEPATVEVYPKAQVQASQLSITSFLRYVPTSQVEHCKSATEEQVTALAQPAMPGQGLHTRSFSPLQPPLSY